MMEKARGLCMLGFTLIELLVTIVIVGTLSGLAIANYQSYKQDANNTVASLTVRDAYMSVEAYKIDDQDLSFNVKDAIFNSDGSSSGNTEILVGYQHSNDVFLEASVYGQASAQNGAIYVYACHKYGSPASDYADTHRLTYRIDTRATAVPKGMLNMTTDSGCAP